MSDYQVMALAAAVIVGLIGAWLGTGSLLDRMRQREHRGSTRRLESANESREIARLRRDKREREAADAIIATDPAVRRGTRRGDVTVTYKIEADGTLALSANDPDVLAEIAAATREALCALVEDRSRMGGPDEAARQMTARAEALPASATLRAARKREDDARVAHLARQAAAHLSRCGKGELAKAISEQGGVASERDGIARVPIFQQNGAR